MIANICAITNRKRRETIRFLERHPDFDLSKYPHMKEVTVIEMKAFFGLLFYRALYGLTKHSTHVLFSDRHGPAVFSATMSRMRFKFLLSHICFDEFEQREEAWKQS